MASRERVINKLKSIGYRFKRDHWRVTVFKRGTHRIEIPKRDILDESWVWNAFRQAEIPKEEITAFLRDCRN